MPGGACRGCQAAVCANAAARAKNAQNKGGAGGAASKPKPAAKKEEPKEDEKPKGLARRICTAVLDFLDQTWLQTLQYIIFLYTFQSLTGTIRKPEEFYFDKYLTDTYIVNPFDADHNKFTDVRRVSDIWEWQRTVLTPGIFSQSPVGEVWSDGDGVFSLEGATPYSTSDIVDMDNVVSYADGIIFKLSRIP